MSKIPNPDACTRGVDARTGDPELELAAYLVETASQQLAHARRRLHRALEQRSARPGRQPATHGTPAGYRRHIRARELPCVPCMEAHRWDAHHRPLRARRAA